MVKGVLCFIVEECPPTEFASLCKNRSPLQRKVASPLMMVLEETLKSLACGVFYDLLQLQLLKGMLHKTSSLDSMDNFLCVF